MALSRSNLNFALISSFLSALPSAAYLVCISIKSAISTLNSFDSLVKSCPLEPAAGAAGEVADSAALCAGGSAAHVTLLTMPQRTPKTTRINMLRP